MTSKVCSKCKQEFPLTSEFFYKSSKSKDGFQFACKLCHSKLCKDYRSKNKDKIREKNNEWARKNPEKARAIRIRSLRKWASNHPERKKELDKKWRDANPEKHRENARKWQRLNPQKRRVIMKRWYKVHAKKARIKQDEWIRLNPEKKKAQINRRRARKVNADGSYTSDHIHSLYDFQEGRCFHCDCDISQGYHIDHWIPLSRGGSNWPENLRLLCEHCNCSKGNKMPWEWSNNYTCTA